MYLLNRRTFMALAGATSATALVPGAARAALSGSEVFTADPGGGLVDSTLVMGEESALLIDAQFTLPNAERLADVIAATGKRLETIIISHYHPDHHLGLSALMARFPEAKPVAHGAVQPLIAGAAQAMQDNLRGVMPPGWVGERAVIPEALPGDAVTLEGERFDVLGPVIGDTGVITPLHLPQLDTLVAADTVYHDTHLWLAETTKPEGIAAWRATLDALEALGAGTVIPGHRAETTVNDAAGFGFMRAYLDAWETALGTPGSAADLKADMVARVGDLPGEMFLDRAVAAARPA